MQFFLEHIFLSVDHKTPRPKEKVWQITVERTTVFIGMCSWGI